MNDEEFDFDKEFKDLEELIIDVRKRAYKIGASLSVPAFLLGLGLGYLIF